MAKKKDVTIWYLEWNKYLLIAFPICVLLDVAGRLLTQEVLHAPLWLDTFGTFIGAIIGGPVYGALVGIIFQLTMIYQEGFVAFVLYGLCTAASACVFGILVRTGFILSVKKAVISGIFLSLFITMMQAPITLALTGGHCESNILAESIYMTLLGWNWYTPFAVIISRFAGELIDKVIVIMCVFFLSNGLMKYFDRYFHTLHMLKITEIVHEEELAENQTEKVGETK